MGGVGDELVPGRLEALALGDVPGDGRGAGDPPGRVPGGRHGERHVAGGAVLAEADGLELLDPLPGGDGGQQLVGFGLAVVRGEDVHRQADRLLGGVAVDALGAPVPADDRPVEGLGGDGVVGRLDHGGEQRPGLLGPLPFGDVADGGGEQHAGVGRQRRQADVDRKLVARLAQPVKLEPGAHRPGAGVGAVVVAVGGVGRPEALGEEALHRLPEQLVAGEAEHPLGLGVDEGDPALAADDHDGIGGSLEERPERRRTGPEPVHARAGTARHFAHLPPLPLGI